MPAILSLALAACASHPSGVLIAEPLAVTTSGGAVVDMLVATTRQPSEEPGVLFSGERGQLAFTEIAVSIPPDTSRKIGEVQWPARMPANPATDFTTTLVQPLGVPQGVRAWANRNVSGDREVLVFVHGFNTRYDEAVYRFAQIVHDSGARVTPVLFTWPSRGDVLQYPYDKESTNYSRTALEEMLWRITQDPSIKKVTVLAHSMGTWLAVESLRQMAIRRHQISPKIKTVMLASADLDVDVLGQQMRDIGTPRPEMVLFVSRDDKALHFSRAFGGNIDRVGQIDPSQEPYRSALEREHGITVIDLQALQTGDELNHSKFAESPEVVRLIGQRLASGQEVETKKSVLGGVGDAVATTADAAISVVRSSGR